MATKTWLIIGAVLAVLGLILFAGAMQANDWDFTRLSTTKYETNTYEIKENFSSIIANTDTADIFVVPSDDGVCKVICHEAQNTKHRVALRDHTLFLSLEDERKWYEHIGINFEKTKITVCLPEAEYASLCITENTGDVKISENFSFESIDISVSTGDINCLASASGTIRIRTDTGDIRVEKASAADLHLSVSTGRVVAQDVTCQGNITVLVTTGDTLLTDVRCSTITSKGRTGDIALKNVIAGERFFLERSTGDVKLDGCDAAELFITTTTGSVSGSLLSDKVFITQTGTGRIDVPGTAAGGRCEITTDTGDIRIKIAQ